MAGTKSAGEVKVLLSVETTSYSAAIDKAKAKLKEMSGASQEMAQHTVSSAAAASGALRGIEGAIPIRAAEKFLSMLPGMGAALQAAFPVIGALAVVEVIARGAKELLAFKQRTEEAGAQFKASVTEMLNGQRLSNDELAKSNIQIENQIAKLTGHHENVLAAQLIDARIEADHLADSATKAAKEMKTLLEQQQSNALFRLATGDGTSPDLFGTINSYMSQYNRAAQDLSDARHNGDKAGEQAAQKRMADLRDSAIDRANQERKTRTGTVTKTVAGEAGNGFDITVPFAEENGDQGKNLTALDAFQGFFQGERDKSDLDAQHTKDVGDQKQAEDAKQAVERAKQATEKLLKEYRDEYAQLQAAMVPKTDEELGQFHARELTEEGLFWARKLSIAKNGTDAYAEIQKQLAEIDTKANQQLAEGLAEAAKLQKKRDDLIDEITSPSNQDLSRSFDTHAALRTSGVDTRGMLKAMNDSVEIAHRNADAQREAAISIGLSAGTLSQLDAAQQMATLHTVQYTRELQSLKDALDAVANNGGLTDLEKKQQSQNIQNQIDDLSAKREIQQAEDQRNVSQQTGLVAWRTSLNQYVNQTKDTASQVRDIWSSTLSGINDQFVKMMTGQRTSWKSMFSGIAGDISKAFLQKAEGSLMSAMGLGGKPDGSASNPLYVKNVDALNSAGGGLTSISSALGGDGRNPTGEGAGGFISTALGMLAGFADGGDPPINVPSIVGENGPELFVPKGAGTIVPNHMLGGGDTHLHMNVDARGATDPAAVDAAVRRGIAKAVPTITAVNLHAQRESAARKPASRR